SQQKTLSYPQEIIFLRIAKIQGVTLNKENPSTAAIRALPAHRLEKSTFSPVYPDPLGEVYIERRRKARGKQVVGLKENSVEKPDPNPQPISANKASVSGFPLNTCGNDA
ncbi:MAG: hypothetical protein R3335_14980, partial [Anaerolineales bacterium]|nr:hypothetical protein [Anaerolineales bacterium]